MLNYEDILRVLLKDTTLGARGYRITTIWANSADQKKKNHFLYPQHTKYAMGVYSFCLFCVSVSLSVSLSVCLSVNIYFVSKISQELLYLET